MAGDKSTGCKLGTLTYWDAHYQLECSNFKHSGDTGDIWFGEDILDKMTNWVDQKVDKESAVVDIGCGNGMSLIDLSLRGYKNLTGIDYSENAVKLARAIAEKHQVDIAYSVGDVLADSLGSEKYDVVLDKGTYDAITLRDDHEMSRTVYINNTYTCLKDNGFLVIASCNWTEEELTSHLTMKYNVFSIIPTPQFKFGGKVGNVVSIVVFQKKITQ